MQFEDYQRRAYATDQNPRVEGVGAAGPSPDLQKPEVIPLLGLVGEVGSLLAEYKKLLRDGATHRKFRDEVAEELGDILWYVANVATKFGLTLETIAKDNLVKVENRWSKRDHRRALYDQALEENQKLPRTFEFRFTHRSVAGLRKLVLVDRRDGTDTGDPLTDNAAEDDGYRFHDVLHLTFAAQLGWSPVLRKLLRNAHRLVKRTPHDFEEVQDGGRAQVIEEAIVAAAYVYAANHDFLEGIDTIDWHLLRHIQEMTSGIEAKDVTAREWNDALVCGFGVWRQLRAHDGGIVRGDLEAGTLTFTPAAAD